MPSPFPGMDPYLEAPDIWPDLHDALAGEIRGALNRSLPPPYYARLEMRPEVGIVDESIAPRRIVPDVSVARGPGPGPQTSVLALLETPRTEISPSIEVGVRAEPLRHAFVEIRDPTRGHRLVTLIEIVSPSNKRPGVDRRALLLKQREVLDSDANLIEVDLLRDGDRLLANLLLADAVARVDPAPDYLVLVNRAWLRIADTSAYQIFPVLLPEPLPCFPVPLRQGHPEVPLDLQFAFRRAYDSGPYQRGLVDYTMPPQPPLARRSRDLGAGPGAPRGPHAVDVGRAGVKFSLTQAFGGRDPYFGSYVPLNFASGARDRGMQDFLRPIGGSALTLNKAD